MPLAYIWWTQNVFKTWQGPGKGVETHLVTATRGERGWFGDESDYPGLEALGKIREAELLAAAKVLGIRQVNFLNYIDGDLDQAPPAEAVARIVGHICRVKPAVVVTFGPDGSYGHPDHIAYRQLEHLSQDYQKELWESQTYYRSFSLVNGGRKGEDDLFAGLR